jgi:hypothetical protein
MVPLADEGQVDAVLSGGDLYEQERFSPAVDRRMATARARRGGGLRMFGGQRRRAMERYEEAMRSLDQSGQRKLSMLWLAAFYLKIVS